MNTKKYTEKMVTIIVLLGLVMVLIAACSDTDISPTMMETDWQWTELEETDPDSVTKVSKRENYVLRMHADRTVGIIADCNVVNGTHTVDGSSLSIELGVSTMAYCGDDSLDELFLDSLSNADSFIIEDGQLKILLKDGAGMMTFDAAE